MENEKASFAIYNASAGAGKTHTLVKEYLKILLLDRQDDAYRKILAITFTNKAVAEMKTRIVACLHSFSTSSDGGKFAAMFKQLVEETGLTPAALTAKSGRIIKSIIHNYASFDISTIDKFTHKVIRSFAYDLDLPMSFEVSLDTEELLQEAVDAVVAEAGVDDELTKLLINFSLAKADEDKSWDVSRDLKEVGQLLLKESNRAQIALFKDKTIEDFDLVSQELRKRVKAISEKIKTLGQGLLATLEREGIDPGSFSRKSFPNHLQKVATDTMATEKRYACVDDVAVNKGAKDGDAIQMILPGMVGDLQEVYRLDGQRAFYQAFLKNITPLSLLNRLEQEMQKIQEEKNILSIAEFNAIIHEQIKEQPAPFIYERLGERYHHFFIDEFQDTSEMQWLNLIPLIDNALAGQDHVGVKGSLMIVGDPKQSIYRWRGGKAEQFIALSKEENPFSNPDKQTVHLDTNYRSYAEVIHFNNAFFNFLSGEFEQADYRDLYENHSFQKTTNKSGGCVTIQLLEESEKGEDAEKKLEEHAEATFEAIQRIVSEGFAYEDIVVLTRKRKEGVLLANYLTERKVPILSSESLLINNAAEVRFIIHVLRFIKNEQDKEAKAMLLYFIARRLALGNEIHDFIAKGLAFETEEALEEALKAEGLEISFKQCRAKSLYDAVEAVVVAFIPDKMTNSYVLYFMDILLERTVKYQYGIGDFLSYWQENYTKFSIPTPEGRNAVQIMTIHKSKGLEFPVVIFPFVEESISHRMRDKLWVEFEDDTLAADLPRALVDSKKDVAQYGTTVAQLFNQQSQEMILDGINVLYVALTRAEEQLHIITRRKTTKEGFAEDISKYFLSYLAHIGTYEEDKDYYVFGQTARVSTPSVQDAHRQHAVIATVANLLDFDAIKIAQKESMMWDSVSQEAIAYGNLVHEIMSYVQTAEDVPIALDRALAEGLILEEQRMKLLTTLEAIVNHPDLLPYFIKGSKVLNERLIIKAGARNSIPDRVVIQGKDAYLLDYKTGKHEEKYKKQINAYAFSLEEMGYVVRKKILLYIGDDLNMIPL